MAKSNVTPAGLADWPRLNSPDTKFAKSDSDAVYKTGLILSGEDAEALKDLCDTEAKDRFKEEIAKADAKKKAALKKYTYAPPYKDEVDEDGEETGNLIFNFKTYAYDKNGKLKKIPLVDAKRKPLGELIGSGSKIKIAFAFSRGYNNATNKTYGTTLYLNAVQVLDLVAPGGGGVSAFDDEEGFESEEDPTNNFDDTGSDVENDADF